MEKRTVDDILDFAITGEIAGNRFYSNLAARMKNPAMREVFEGFAAEELEHRDKLEAIKRGGKIEPEEVADLKIADFVEDVEPRDDMEYKDALVVAMKQEKAAFKLYSELASLTQDEDVRNIFLMLAQEEAKHKLRFEIEYDELVLGEN